MDTQCTARTKDRNRCKNAGKHDGLCTLHKNARARHAAEIEMRGNETLCTTRKTDGTLCGNDLVEDGMCSFHLTIHANYLIQEDIKTGITNIMIFIENFDGELVWSDIDRELPRILHDIPRRLWNGIYRKLNTDLFQSVRLDMFDVLMNGDAVTWDILQVQFANKLNILLPMEQERVHIFVARHIQLRNERPPVPRNRMAQLAIDAQNTHTQEVNDQTTTTLAYLRSFPRTIAGSSVEWAIGRFVYHNYSVTGQLTHDMRRMSDEHLDYFDAMNGIYEYIHSKKANADLVGELLKRLYEECVESIGMCAQGHVSRLCNVLVGFDEKVKSSTPLLGERLQMEMAKIAEMDAESTEKRTMATEWMVQNNVHVNQRDEWLSAF